MKYIESFREGDRISDVYLCKFKQAALTKAGKPYDIVILQDKTGTIDSKIWDPDSIGIDDFEVLDYVCITGDVSIYNGSPQLSIKRARKADEGEYNPSDYLPMSEYDIDGMFVELMGYINSIKNPYYSQLLHAFFDNTAFEKKFKFHSAAKSVHHGFVGGLLEHTLSVTRNCDFFAKQYPILNRDLLLTAAMFHDLGKLKELSTFPENDYTDAGNLLGHIVMGCEMLNDQIRQIEGFPVVLANELKHCILAHHGELEFGSPKKPALVEALCLSFADNLDAKMETVKEILNGVPENNLEWQGYNRLLESNIRRTSSDK
ncbi:MAG: HD domain-containing protein [Agathobacter sp.]|nr:HD domain-containing protein [Agathobacter sp.]